MKNQVKTLGAVSIAAMVLPGCASIVSRSDWPVAIKSTPDQAEFTIINKKGGKIHSGTTPVTVTLPGKDGYFSGETYNVSYSKTGLRQATRTRQLRLIPALTVGFGVILFSVASLDF